MSFTYSAASVTSDRDRLRLVIGDTNSTSYVFEDEELDAFLALWPGDINLAAAQALRAIAASQARLAIYYTVNGFSMDRRQLGQRLADLADKLEERAATTPFELVGVMDHFVDDSGVDRSLYGDEADVTSG